MQRLTWIPGASVVVALTLVPTGWGPFAQGRVDIRVVSSRPDMVSGGDALIEITGASAPSAPPAVSVTVNGRDVTSAFRAVAPGWRLLGRIDSLTLGKNTVEVRTGGSRQARLELTNHSGSGPVFSGPHQTPFVCQTDAAGLGPAVDANCTAQTVVTYVYKSTASPASPAARGAGAAPGRGG